MLHAESTTQSALSFRVAISEAISSPSSASVGTSGGVSTKSRLSKTGEITRDETMRRKFDYAILAQRRRLDPRFGRRLAQVDAFGGAPSIWAMALSSSAASGNGASSRTARTSAWPSR